MNLKLNSLYIKIIITITLIIVSVISVFFILKYIESRTYVSPNTLHLTEPITSISGTIKEINGSILTLEMTPNNPSSLLQSSNAEDKNTKNIIYKVEISSNTTIYQPVNNVPYLFKPLNPKTDNIVDTSTLKVGASVSINSTVDLRTLKKNKFEALAIHLPPTNNILNGVITSITKNFIVVNDREILISDNTEISNLIYKQSLSDSATVLTPNKYNLADLTTNMTVTIYCDTDIGEGSSLTALRIEPIIPTTSIPAPTTTPIPTIIP